jgi:hypothetical protein
MMVMLLTAGVASANNKWSGFHSERSSNPAVVPLGNNLSGDWVALLGLVSGESSGSGVIDTPVATGLGCGLVAGTTQVCNGDYGNNGWLGLATISVLGDHILAGRAKVNDYYFDQDYYNDPNAKQHVLCQEIFHTVAWIIRRSLKRVAA